MLNRIFPKHISNQYTGSQIALWLFAAMTVLTVARSLAHIFLPDGGAQSIATIPLDAFSSAAAAVVIGMFAQWGLTQLMFGLLYALVLWIPVAGPAHVGVHLLRVDRPAVVGVLQAF